jgi:dihydrofolate reductase
MRKLRVFNSISLDGYFTDAHGDMSWAHKQNDPEWEAFTSENASGGGELVFGRVTYEMMVSYWPTPEAKEAMPVVAEQMNSLPKVVFSRSLDEASWTNTELITDNIEDAIRSKKQASGPDMVIMGSGTIVSQLTQAGLIDEYQLVLNPIVLGSGRTLFEGVKENVDLKLTNTRAFGNGNVVMWYEPAGS